MNARKAWASTSMSSAVSSSPSASDISSTCPVSWKHVPRAVAWVLRPFPILASTEAASSATSTSYFHIWWPSLLYPAWKDAATDASVFHQPSTHIKLHSCTNAVALKHLQRNMVPAKMAVGQRGANKLSKRVVCYYLGGNIQMKTRNSAPFPSIAEWNVADTDNDVRHYREYYDDALTAHVKLLLDSHKSEKLPGIDLFEEYVLPLLRCAIEEVYIFLGRNDEQLKSGIALLQQRKIDGGDETVKTRKRKHGDAQKMSKVAKKQATNHNVAHEDQIDATPEWYHEWGTQTQTQALCSSSQQQRRQIDPSQFSQLKAYWQSVAQESNLDPKESEGQKREGISQLQQETVTSAERETDRVIHSAMLSEKDNEQKSEEGKTIPAQAVAFFDPKTNTNDEVQGSKMNLASSVCVESSPQNSTLETVDVAIETRMLRPDPTRERDDNQGEAAKLLINNEKTIVTPIERLESDASNGDRANGSPSESDVAVVPTLSTSQAEMSADDNIPSSSSPVIQGEQALQGSNNDSITPERGIDFALLTRAPLDEDDAEAVAMREQNRSDFAHVPLTGERTGAFLKPIVMQTEDGGETKSSRESNEMHAVTPYPHHHSQSTKSVSTSSEQRLLITEGRPDASGSINPKVTALNKLSPCMSQCKLPLAKTFSAEKELSATGSHAVTPAIHRGSATSGDERDEETFKYFCDESAGNFLVDEQHISLPSDKLLVQFEGLPCMEPEDDNTGDDDFAGDFLTQDDIMLPFT